MISWTKCSGERLMTDQMVLMRGDHASLVKMMITEAEGRDLS